MSVYQHFREHEHPFIDRVLSWIDQVENMYTVYVSDFLDPREQQIIAMLIGSANDAIHYDFFGGVSAAERKRAVIAPKFVPIEKNDFGIVALQATFANKFISLTHRDVLGSIASLGIDRSKLGDIFVHDDAGIIQLVTTEPLAPFMQMHLTKIKQASLTFAPIPFTELKQVEQQWEEKLITVSSLRLDVVLKEMYQLSRTKASKLIAAERVKINHTLVNEPAIQLEENDLLSVRGFGRSKLIKVHGTTRKGKLNVTIGFLVG